MSSPRFLLSDVSFDQAEEQAVLDVIRSRWLSLGPQTEAFEREFAQFTGAPHAVAVTNGTTALHLALISLGIGPGDEVLVPSYTFVATANAVRHAGATPVFVDITGPHDLNIDPTLIEAAVTPATRAILVVHLAGFIADMDRVMEIARRHNLVVVEDACHAVGATYRSPRPNSSLNGLQAGVLGDAGCFSFFANKNMATGEGGMLVTTHEEVAQRARLGRSHGMTKSSWDKAKGRATGYDVVQSGYNYRPTELVSALGRVQLAKLPANMRRRGELVQAYREQLSQLPLEIPFLGREGGYHIMPVLVRAAEDREPLRSELQRLGVQTSVHYPPVHQFTHFRSFVRQDSGLERTCDASAREFTLPLHPGLSDEDIGEICKLCSDAVEAVCGQPTGLAETSKS